MKVLVPSSRGHFCSCLPLKLMASGNYAEHAPACHTSLNRPTGIGHYNVEDSIENQRLIGCVDSHDKII